MSVPKLPPETLAWLAAAEQAGGDAAGSPIPGLDASWNALPFLSVFADTFLGVASVNAVHELGHRIMAGVRSPCFTCCACCACVRFRLTGGVSVGSLANHVSLMGVPYARSAEWRENALLVLSMPGRRFLQRA